MRRTWNPASRSAAARADTRANTFSPWDTGAPVKRVRGIGCQSSSVSRAAVLRAVGSGKLALKA